MAMCVRRGGGKAPDGRGGWMAGPAGHGTATTILRATTYPPPPAASTTLLRATTYPAGPPPAPTTSFRAATYPAGPPCTYN
eukprot:127619-Chlamydomonas_euryale.AAC.1